MRSHRIQSLGEGWWRDRAHVPPSGGGDLDWRRARGEWEGEAEHMAVPGKDGGHSNTDKAAVQPRTHTQPLMQARKTQPMHTGWDGENDREKVNALGGRRRDICAGRAAGLGQGRLSVCLPVESCPCPCSALFFQSPCPSAVPPPSLSVPVLVSRHAMCAAIQEEERRARCCHARPCLSER